MKILRIVYFVIFIKNHFGFFKKTYYHHKTQSLLSRTKIVTRQNKFKNCEAIKLPIKSFL